jgi:hypothetical protein
MKKIGYPLFALAASLLAGCPAGYVKPGATQPQYYADMTACMHEVGNLMGVGKAQQTTVNVEAEDEPTGPFDTEVGRNMAEQCMQARGWRLVREGQRFYPFN